MKVEEIRKMSDDELKAKIVELKKQLMELRFKNSIGALEKPSEIRATKKTIARILTILRERELQKEGNK